MNINDLPDDCLLTVFSYSNDLESLSRFYFVCQKWKQLISKQLKKYKILLAGSTIFRLIVINDYSTVHTCSGLLLKQFYPLMPNIEILFPAFYFYSRNDKDDLSNEKECYEQIYTILNESTSIKGLCDISYANYDEMLINVPARAVGRLEMLSAMVSSQLMQNIQSFKLSELRACNWVQLKIVASLLQSPNFFKRLLNLQRLSLTGLPERNSNTRWPHLYNLKMLECVLYNDNNLSLIRKPSDFQFVDACPVLESLFLYFEKYGDYQLKVDWNVKNFHLNDLVLETDEEYTDRGNIERLVMKFPNTKHLAIRGFKSLRLQDLPELVKLLPKLVLLDLRDSPLIDERVVDYIDNRPITVIHNGNFNDEQINREWPQLKRSDPRDNFYICKGFDFMKNCFFMSYAKLPHLMY